MSEPDVAEVHGDHDAGDGWTRAFYETPVAMALLPQAAAEIDTRVACIERALELRGGERVLDQCCGAGSLALALARKGHAVAGVDISSGFIARARIDAAAQALDADFACADAARWSAPVPCDAGFNWGTGFGCAADDGVNRAMLERARDSLRPGARFALDYYNVAGVLAGFRERFAYERELEGRRVRVERRSVLDLERGLLHQDWSFHDAGRVTAMPRTTTRLYLPAELAGLLAGAGFAVESFLGGYDGRPLDIEAPRCIAIARKST
jgi:SAM-dependent methyltransferase